MSQADRNQHTHIKHVHTQTYLFLDADHLLSMSGSQTFAETVAAFFII